MIFFPASSTLEVSEFFVSDLAKVSTIIVSVIINAVQIALTGSSIGKWFLGVRVLNNEYKTMGFKLAFKRELMVLYRGEVLCTPIISMITEFIAYRKLCKSGITTWDRDLHCIVLHKHMGFLQIFLCIVGFTILLGGYYVVGIIGR